MWMDGIVYVSMKCMYRSRHTGFSGWFVLCYFGYFEDLLPKNRHFSTLGYRNIPILWSLVLKLSKIWSKGLRFTKTSKPEPATKIRVTGTCVMETQTAAALSGNYRVFFFLPIDHSITTYPSSRMGVSRDSTPSAARESLLLWNRKTGIKVTGKRSGKLTTITLPLVLPLDDILSTCQMSKK